MELQQIELENFRQFVDEAVEFATDSKQNVTVIHGPNGSGKTTLLNAFRWVLYGSVDFEKRPEVLANEGAMAEASVGETVRVAVTLTFRHHGDTYTATRWRTYRKRDEDDLEGTIVDSDLELEIIDENGVVDEPQNPSNRLDKVIPQRLQDLFFFDGEYIKDLAGIDNQDEVQKAIQNLMGLTIMERSITHLDSVAGQFEDEMDEYGSDELRELLDKRQSIEDNLEDARQRLKDTEEEIDRIQTDIDEIERQQGDIEEAAELKEKRDDLRKRRQELDEEIEAANDSLRSEISDAGYLTFAMKPVRETAEELDDLRERGLIPSELSNEFVDSLLDRERCVCGRSLEEGTDHYEEVASWRSEMNSEGVDQAAIRLISHIEQFSQRREELFEELDAAVSRRRERQTKVERLTEQIDEISAELEEMDIDLGKDVESPAELERRRKDLVTQKEDALGRQGQVKNEIEDLEDELKRVTNELEDARDEQDQAKTARRRWKAAQEVRDELDAEFEDLKDKVRQWSDRLVNKTYDRIAHRDFEAHINDDFRLVIEERVDGQLREKLQSRGEKQIASLAFIGSLVSIAKDRYESETENPYFEGGIYPVVMDSPFGALDSEHRGAVGRAMPDLAHQVVVFVTDTQWRGPVEREMSKVAGKQYWLDFEGEDREGESPRTTIKTEET